MLQVLAQVGIGARNKGIPGKRKRKAQQHSEFPDVGEPVVYPRGVEVSTTNAWLAKKFDFTDQLSGKYTQW